MGPNAGVNGVRTTRDWLGEGNSAHYRTPRTHMLTAMPVDLSIRLMAWRY